jgi:uncharacterized protein YkwD
MSPRRACFRVALAGALVWSAFPTVAGALGSGDRDGDRAQPSRTATTAAVTTSTTSTVLPTTTVPPAPPTTTLATPVIDAAPPSTAPPVPAPQVSPAPLPSPPSPSSAPAPVVSAAAACDTTANALLVATNRDRRANGLPELCDDARLDQLAQGWADWMAAHLAFQHQDLAAVIGTTGYSTLAENILAGPGVLTTDQMEQAWMQSPGHREHILSRAFIAAGVGITRGGDGRVWAVVDFGG